MIDIGTVRVASRRYYIIYILIFTVFLIILIILIVLIIIAIMQIGFSSFAFCIQHILLLLRK